MDETRPTEARPGATGPGDTGPAVEVAPGLRRLRAPNPSALTGTGTNTYLVGRGEIAVVDPGPDDDAHLGALLRAVAGERVGAILVTHAHLDHSALAPRLAARTGAPVMAFGDAPAGRSAAMARLVAAGADLGGGEGVDRGFAPDARLADGARVGVGGASLVALHTPGHMGNHLSFKVGDAILSGDLAMGWASTLVSPPDGDVSDFIASCERLRRLGARRLLPGHGELVDDPSARLGWLIAHRRTREAQILAALAEGAADPLALVARLYTDTPRPLWPAAARNALAHLIDLEARGLVAADAPLGPAARFRLA